MLCYHGGFSHDLKTGELIEPDTGENQGYQMCRELDFDILITGHQHREISTKAFGKSIVQPGSKASCVAAIALDVEIENGKVLSVHHEPSLHYVSEDTPVHPGIVSRIADFHAQTEKWLDQPMGRIEGNLLFEMRLRFVFINILILNSFKTCKWMRQMHPYLVPPCFTMGLVGFQMK